MTILTIDKVLQSIDSNSFSLEVSRLVLLILLLQCPIRRLSLSLSLRRLWGLVIAKNSSISVTVALEHSIHIMAHKDGKDEVNLSHNVVNAGRYVLAVEESIVLDAA